ncbi:hypothetical protein Tsp_06898 [Trichinella spiralis]|nr:hypothetical protein Tsp_06898 [Trichinella spiralis]
MTGLFSNCNCKIQNCSVTTVNSTHWAKYGHVEIQFQC